MEKETNVQSAAKKIDDDEIKARWLSESPNAAYWGGVIKAVMKRRNEIIELVLEQHGADRHVIDLDRKIADHLAELEACGINPSQSEYLDELKSLRVVAGRAAVLLVIDDRLVQKTLDWKRAKMREIKEQCKTESAAASRKTKTDDPA